MTLALIVAGCQTSRPPGTSPALKLKPQSSAANQCGPSTLASVLNFHGEDVTEGEIAEAIFSETVGGVLMTDLAWYARERGLRTSIRSGTIDDLEQAVARGEPPIVLLDLGVGRLRRGHFTAVTGFAGDGLFFIGQERVDHFERLERFDKQWKRAGNRYLIISR